MRLLYMEGNFCGHTFRKSPPCIMKPLMILWNVHPLYPSGMPFFLHGMRTVMLLVIPADTQDWRRLHVTSPGFASAKLPEIFRGLRADVSEQLHLDAPHRLPTHGHIYMHMLHSAAWTRM